MVNVSVTRKFTEMGKKKKLYKKWLFQAGAGATLIGFGQVVTIEAAFLKHAPETPWYVWVTVGTFGLAVFIAGIAVMIDAVRLKMKIEKG